MGNEQSSGLSAEAQEAEQQARENDIREIAKREYLKQHYADLLHNKVSGTNAGHPREQGPVAPSVNQSSSAIGE